MERSAAPISQSRCQLLAQRAWFVGIGAGIIVVLGAASPKQPDLAFQAQGVSPMGENVAPVKVIKVQSAMYEPAPMPNPDADGPAGAVAAAGGLSPRLFSSKNEFEGDGYSYGSSQSATLDARKQPAAGLGLSVPLIK